MTAPGAGAPRVFGALTSSELGDAFAEARRNGLHVDAVIAIDASPEMLHDYFSLNPACRYRPILAETRYATLLRAMPYWNRLETGCELENYLMTCPSEWGFFAITAANGELHCSHWRSLCEVILPSGDTSFFRFQDSAPLRRMLPTYSDQELGWFMGPAARLIIPACNGDGERGWLDVPNPALSGRSEQELAENYRPAPEWPWWEVREEHLAGMAQEQRAALIYNLTNVLMGEAPYTALLVEQHYGSVESGIGEYVDAAMEYGLSEEEHISLFMQICLLLPIGSQHEPDVAEAMQGAKQDPFSALNRLHKLITADTAP